MNKDYKKLIDLIQTLKCDECDGSGEYSTPCDFGPCGNCDGTGFVIDGCYNDTFSDIDKL